MKPIKLSKEYQAQMFKIELIDLVDMDHSLVKLANKFNWSEVELICDKYFCVDNGRRALSSRLVVGLLLLKQLDDLSDIEVCRKFVENPYYQYFCGYKHFEHKLNLNPTSLTIWRKRFGDEVFQKILGETILLGLQEKVITSKDVKEVISDTTVQEKNISYPTDGKLLCRAIEHLVKIGTSSGVKFRQSYKRTSVKLRNKAARLLHGRKPGQANAALSQLRTRLGRVIREVERQLNTLNLSHDQRLRLEHKLDLAKRIFEQRRESQDKVYSLHEPEVGCIAKGKVHKKYEFGNKVGIVSTIKNSFILAVESFSNNPYDGHTLQSLLVATELNTGIEPSLVVLDKGYKGVKRQFPDKTIMISGDRKLSPPMKKKLKQRSKIEPLIGLAKSKCGLARNRLKGVIGDKINAVLSAIAYNLRIILRELFYLFLIYGILAKKFANWTNSTTGIKIQVAE